MAGNQHDTKNREAFLIAKQNLRLRKILDTIFHKEPLACMIGNRHDIKMPTQHLCKPWYVFLFLISGQVPARMVLYMLSWSGFLVSFMMRTDINIAIVAMVADPKQAKHDNSSSGEQYCYTADRMQERTDTLVRKLFKIFPYYFVPNYFLTFYRYY